MLLRKCSSQTITTFIASFLKSVKNPRILRRLHARIVVSGVPHHDVYTSNKLIQAYTSLGLIDNARKVFYDIPKKNVVSWTILISGFAKRGHFYDAVVLFREMLNAGVMPNEVTFTAVLPAFGNLGLELMGRAVHGFWVRRVFDRCVFVDTCLVGFYSRVGRMEVAQNVFDEMPDKSVASWNVIISGYASNGMGALALELFNLMREDVGFVDHFTCMSVISAVSTQRCPRMSYAVHGLLVKLGFGNEVQVQTGLIKMYAGGSLIDEAHSVFCGMETRDLVAWTQMLKGFSSCQQWSKAIEHFSEMMILYRKSLDSSAFVSILGSCSGSGALLQGRRAHALIVKKGFGNDVLVGSALIDMYTTCGDLDSGNSCFFTMDEKDVACWNAMIKAMGANGYGEPAVELLRRMKALGYKPNESTLVSVLSACSHAGMVDVGVQIFRQMEERWGVVPNMQHYACVVDMLGRSGRLDEACAMMDMMPAQPHMEVYGALLNACKIYGNTEMGDRIFKQLMKLDRKDAGHFCSALNMYASAGDWKGVAMSNVALSLQGVRKDPGYSSTELNTHAFAS